MKGTRMAGNDSKTKRSTPATKLCEGCGQPMLPDGAKKLPNEYDHAQGCPLDKATQQVEQATPWTPGAWEARTYELVQLRAELARVTEERDRYQKILEDIAFHSILRSIDDSPD